MLRTVLPVSLLRTSCTLGLGLAMLQVLAPGNAAAAAKGSAAEEQLRIVHTMMDQMRTRIDRLPVLLPADQPVGVVQATTVTLNRDPVIVAGERFDGLVITAPATKAGFGWAFVCPPHATRWYVFREHGEMKGFTNFLRRPRDKLPGSDTLVPPEVTQVTVQKLDAASLAPGARYVLWFAFRDDAPATFSIRAGYFVGNLTNERLAPLLFPAQ